MRNPRSSGGGRMSIRNVVRDTLIPAGIGAAGGLAVNVLMGYVNPYLPSQFQQTAGAFNALNTAAQLAGAVGVGMLAHKFLGGGKGKEVAVGAATVVLYAALSNLAAGTIPGIAGLRDYTPFPTHGVGAYLPRRAVSSPAPGRLRGLGYITPGTVVGPALSPRMGAYLPRGANVMPEETGL